MATKPANPARPGPAGMTQGTYTGNVSFSRGNSDLIASGASLPSGGSGPVQKAGSKPSGTLESAFVGATGRPMGFFNPSGSFDSSNQSTRQVPLSQFGNK